MLEKAKPFIVLIGLGLLVTGGVLVASNYKNKPKASDSSFSSKYIVSDSCELLTQELANETLGGNTTKSDTSSIGGSTDDMLISACSYSLDKTPDDGNPTDTITVTLLVRSAKTAVGAASNQSQFAIYPEDSEAVDGIGQSAYWKQNVGQLNVYLNNNWYIISIGGTNTVSHNIDDAKALASKMLN